MKNSSIFQISLFVSAVSLLAYCKPADPVPETVVQREDTMSIAQVRLFHENPIPSRIRVTDAGREGVFTLDEADMSSSDNMGTTLVTTKGHRYKRAYSGSASAYWFGVDVADTDIGPELQTAVTAVSDLTIPDGTYTQTTPVHLKSNIAIRANPGKVTIKLPKSYISLVNPDDPKIPLNDILIDGLSWITSSQEKGTYGTIYIDGPSITNLTIQNCAGNDAAAKDSTNWLTVKIQANRTGKDIVVRNNTVQAKRMACEIFNHDNYNVYAGKNITVSNNSFSNCRFGISLSGPLDQLTVANNYLKNCSLFGIEIAGAAQNVSIINNKFEGVFDKFLTGSNDGSGPDKNGGTIIGGMIVSGNGTVGTVTGGIQFFNGGAIQFTKNTFSMTGMLELAHSTAGGLFTENVIESAANKAIICDNSPNNTFINNTISNKTNPGNQATLMAYGSKATNNVLTNNKLIQGSGGKPYDAVLGGSVKASMNYDESGNLLP
ncbi:right-handed parallel beta-helix repeat-containing protein [Spirosoma fluviale]|uniref:Polygalacturonase n=1 Tax=Spirosoma fluviale TaxID=1597977 RepID=A0A286G949_9BACT|nr:right-handed parallel beta-helix repeat-containing protein [Spirosoma fluviale]SOD92050.1 Polygalacturonase [Spirosoma fluviale]